MYIPIACDYMCNSWMTNFVYGLEQFHPSIFFPMCIYQMPAIICACNMSLYRTILMIIMTRVRCCIFLLADAAQPAIYIDLCELALYLQQQL